MTQLPRPTERLCSSDFAEGGFRPHGEFACWMEQGLLIWEGRGPFNLEALQAYGRTRQAAFQRWQLNGKPIGAVMHWVDSALMSPEAFAHYERSFEAFIMSRHHYVAVAWAGDAGVEGLDLMQAKYAPLFERHGLAFGVFTDVELAKRWVLPRVRQAQQPALP